MDLQIAPEVIARPARAIYRILGRVFRFGATIGASVALVIATGVLSLSAFEAYVLNLTAVIDNRPFVVINKINGETEEGRGVDPMNEWVELFNKSEMPVDINGWEICDGASCDTIRTKRPLKPGDYVVLTGKRSTWEYWHVPKGVRKVLIEDGAIGDGLGDEYDMLILRDLDDRIIDQMNWGIPATSTWANFNNKLWDPGVPDVSRGHLLCRTPNGYDTGTTTDFADCGLPPIVSVQAPAEDSKLIFGETFAINWTAENRGASGDDLALAIYLITDNDASGAVSKGDRMYKIADRLTDTGGYNWIADHKFGGLLWIRVVAFGSANPMFNGFGMSGAFKIIEEETPGPRRGPHAPHSPHAPHLSHEPHDPHDPHLPHLPQESTEPREGGVKIELYGLYLRSENDEGDISDFIVMEYPDEMENDEEASETAASHASESSNDENANAPDDDTDNKKEKSDTADEHASSTPPAEEQSDTDDTANDTDADAPKEKEREKQKEEESLSETPSPPAPEPTPSPTPEPEPTPPPTPTPTPNPEPPIE